MSLWPSHGRMNMPSMMVRCCPPAGARSPWKRFERAYIETHVEHSNALHSHAVDGKSYFVGPLARLNLNYEQLRPVARQAAEEAGLQLPLRNPFKGLLARAIELVEVCDAGD